MLFTYTYRGADYTGTLVKKVGSWYHMKMVNCEKIHKVRRSVIRTNTDNIITYLCNLECPNAKGIRYSGYRYLSNSRERSYETRKRNAYSLNMPELIRENLLLASGAEERPMGIYNMLRSQSNNLPTRYIPRYFHRTDSESDLIDIMITVLSNARSDRRDPTIQYTKLIKDTFEKIWGFMKDSKTVPVSVAMVQVKRLFEGSLVLGDRSKTFCIVYRVLYKMMTMGDTHFEIFKTIFNQRIETFLSGYLRGYLNVRFYPKEFEEHSCPVCFEDYSPGDYIIQMHSDSKHHVCSMCAPKLRNCPMCRARIEHVY